MLKFSPVLPPELAACTACGAVMNNNDQPDTFCVELGFQVGACANCGHAMGFIPNSHAFDLSPSQAHTLATIRPRFDRFRQTVEQVVSRLWG